MKTSRRLSWLTGLIVAGAVWRPVWATDILTQPVRGEWCSNLWAAKAYAEQQHVPMLAVWTCFDCGDFDSFIRAAGMPEVMSVLRKYNAVGAIYRAPEWTESAEWLWCSLNNSVGESPACRLYWPMANGTVENLAFAGLVGQIPEGGATGTLAEQLARGLTDVLGRWAGSAPSVVPWPGPAPATVCERLERELEAMRQRRCENQSYSGVWSSSRKLDGVVMEGSRAVGTCVVKCGKRNKKGIARVSAKLTFVDGRKKLFYRSQKVTATDVVTVAWADGFTLTVDAASFVGGKGGLKVETAHVGGDVSCGHALVLDARPAWGDLAFDADGRRWDFPASSAVRKSKLTYNAKTGLFKGKLKLVNDPTGGADGNRRLIGLKVNGLVVEGLFFGRGVYKSFVTTVSGQ